MGARGPSKKPTALKVVQGTATKKDAERNEPKPKTGIPIAPEYLSESALKYWDVFIDGLKDTKMLTIVDGYALSMACIALDLMVEALDQIKLDGTTVLDERGLTRKHPAFQVLRDNTVMYHKWAGEFGLTPAARAKITLPDTGVKENPLMDFLAHGKNNRVCK